MKEFFFPFPAVSTRLKFFNSEKNFNRFFISHSHSSILCDGALKKFLPAKIRKKAIYLPVGEEAKDWKILEFVLLELAKRGHERNMPLLVMGGGACCDLGALAASLYRRGVPLILIPTTLLAQVDAGVGGKSAVNLRVGKALWKNFAGAFYPAQEVWISPHWLETLSERERRSGLGEVLKALYLAGKKPALASMQNFLKTGLPDKKLSTQIVDSIRIKAAVVRKDPLDKKHIRECLNYGHSIGHALESLASGELSHGEAIAFGMVLETLFHEEKLGKAPKFSQQISRELQCLGFRLPARLAKAKEAEYLSLLAGDKKILHGELVMLVALRSGVIRKISVAPNELAKFCAHNIQKWLSDAGK